VTESERQVDTEHTPAHTQQQPAGPAAHLLAAAAAEAHANELESPNDDDDRSAY
jgi:hypothetical protein